MKIVKAGTQKEPSKVELDNRILARKAAAEGFVLLENNGVLPLKTNRVALYGAGARMTVKGGTGSGAVHERYSVSIAEGLEQAGMEITTTNWLDRFDVYYTETYENYRQKIEKKVEGIRDFFQILHLAGKFQHPVGIPITEKDIKDSHTDTAIYVLARQAGEGADREDKQGDYRLEDIEIQNLRVASENYKKLIVIVNAGGVVDLSFMDKMRVDALVYFVQGGEEGGNALADVLTGKNNFSGKLATSWSYKFEDIPSNTTYSYLGKDEYQQEYNEGIYVGYRYFDTFGVKPRYRFGYGLSYTDFDINTHDIRQEEEQILVKVNVKNKGAVSGKEVVQIYVTVPFGKSGTEYQRLTAFQKTKELSENEEENVELNFSLRDLTVYDTDQAAFILRKGEYILRIGNSSANTTPVCVLNVSEDKIVEQCMNICPVQHEVQEIKPEERIPENLKDIKMLNVNVEFVEIKTHHYEKPAVYKNDKIKKKVENMTTEQCAMLVCGGGTNGKNLIVAAMGASGTTTPDLYKSLGIPNVVLSDGPAGLNLTSQIVELPDGNYKAANVPENLEAYKRYLFGFNKIALTSQMAKPEEGKVHYQYTTAWPCSQLLAQSFNTELMEQIGEAVGMEMEIYGVTVWLAPGMNIHRNPLCGRTFEYYSEDPYVTGKMAAAITRGVQSHPGKGVSIKHFAANNCELHRNESSSNVNERALRELYLRGFEIAVKESEPMTVMASYNMINGIHATNNYDLLVKVLRNEWEYQGLVMSDWDSITSSKEDCTKAATGDILKAAAAQCDLVMPGRKDQIEALKKGMADGRVDIEDVRRCAARVLSMIEKNTVCEMQE